MTANPLELQLRRCRVFADAPARDLRALVDHATPRRFAAGERLLDEGDPSRHLFVLLEGRVGVFYSSDQGSDVLVKVFGPVAVFGEMELFFDLARQEYVEAFEPGELLQIAAQPALRYLRTHSAACFTLLQDMAGRLCVTAYHQRALAFADVETRVANLLLTFLEAFGTPASGAVTLQLRLTYEMIARCLGVTERSVERCIGGWLKQGWLSRSRGRYSFASRAALEARADPARLLLFNRVGRAPRGEEAPGPDGW